MFNTPALPSLSVKINSLSEMKLIPHGIPSPEATSTSLKLFADIDIGKKHMPNKTKSDKNFLMRNPTTFS
jgi:hypothetical protein